MKIYRIANLVVFSVVLSIAVAARADDKAVPAWDPAVFRDATIKIITT